MLGETTSTNDDARAAADRGAPHGHLVIADAQTQGRGSHGRTWSSPAGSDLYASFVVRPSGSAAALSALTLAIGLGIARALGTEFGLSGNVEVKWPNDVLVDGLKCAGILVESSTRGAAIDSVVVGFGINVRRTTFDDGIAATSLALAGATVLDRSVVVAAALDALEPLIDQFFAEGIGAIRDALEPRLAMRGERVSCDGHEGVLMGLASDGALRLRTESGMVDVRAGRLERMTRA